MTKNQQTDSKQEDNIYSGTLTLNSQCLTLTHLLSRSRFPVAVLVCASQHDLSVAFVLLIMERNEVLHSLSHASFHCATLACSLCVRSWPRGGTPRQALANSKFVHHSTSSFMVMDSQDPPRALRHAKRDLEHHASRYTCGFLLEEKEENEKKKKKKKDQGGAATFERVPV